ncbi:pyridoxal phosphate-dependent decarboxylase family protein [Mesorhizobium sp. AaZ16]|uniref:pyridoxal phosphate-dependent decarboxylase family protein n=1 Tax=Mesorhizobium sp. AaZ16 TaxID=3402289 RepID=UPI00374F4F83
MNLHSSRDAAYAKAFIGNTATSEQRQLFNDILEIGLQFVSGAELRAGGVLNYTALEDLKSLIAEPLPLNGLTYSELLQTLLRQVVHPAIAQHDKRYLAFPDTGNSVGAIAADLLIPFLNQNLIAVDRSAPSASLIEIQLISWLRQLVGYQTSDMNRPDFSLAQVGGLWTTGGNMSNHIALLAAMQKHFPNAAKRGLANRSKKPTFVLAQGIEHFSFAAAARVLGIGEDNILWCKATNDYTTDPHSVQEVLRDCPSDREPFSVVCVTGNCRTANIDSINSLREICDEHRLWLHVDACHGGSLLFSERHRALVSGIEKADSVSLDPHKGLFVPYPSSYVLFKDASSLKPFCRYPQKFDDPGNLDLGLITPFLGSRGFHSLKLWLLIKHLGLSGIADAIDARSSLNASMTSDLAATQLFCLLNSNIFYRQAFVLLPHDLMMVLQQYRDDTVESTRLANLVSLATRNFSDDLYRRGKVCLDSYTLADLDNRVGLGPGRKYEAAAMAIGHTSIDPGTRIEIWHEIREVALPHCKWLRQHVSEKTNVDLAIDNTASPASW